MTTKIVRFFSLMLVSIIVGSGMTSCSSDDDPSETVISQLEQKLIGGMWLDGSLEKGNLVTMNFLKGNKAVLNVILDSTEYLKQKECSYEIKDSTVYIIGKDYQARMIVKSIDDKKMDVEVINFPAEGQTTSTTYIRRYPSLAGNLGNTNWTLKKSSSIYRLSLIISLR